MTPRVHRTLVLRRAFTAVYRQGLAIGLFYGVVGGSAVGGTVVALFMDWLKALAGR